MPFRINRKTYRSDGNVILVLFILSGLFLTTCENLEYERVIKLETGSISNNSSNSATIEGVIIDIGEDGILQHGHCWSTTPNPTADLATKTQLGVKKERSTFVSNLTGLLPGITYYVRAYATNAQGTAYGTEVNFKTHDKTPVAAFTAEPTIINAGQSVQFADQSVNFPTSWSWNFGDGGLSTLHNPSHTYSTAGIYTVTLTATNSAGSDSETKMDFISVSKVYKLEYVSGDNQTYYGGDMPLPMVFKIKNVTDNLYITDLASENLSLSSTATIGHLDVSFNNQNNYCGNGDYACYGGNYYVKINSGSAYVLSILVSLKKGDQVVFDYRIKADITTCPSTGSFTDRRDGQPYDWVKIDNNIWMAENLAYLPSVSPPSSGSSTSAYYYVMGYDGTSVSAAKATANYTTYGVLYNWPAAMAGDASSNSIPSGMQGVCPSNWHLPSDAEWIQLTDFLGGETVAGGKMKAINSPPWADPNTGATNSSGFSGLPGGYRRDNTGAFSNLFTYAMWWSTLEDISLPDAKGRGLYNADTWVYNNNYLKAHGFSVRCIND